MPESTAKMSERPPEVRGTAGLAKHLGVSRWTISRVLNGHAGVREETRKRVLAAVKELGFEPNKLARSLRGVPSGLVGVSFPHLEAMVMAQKSQALQKELKEAGFRGIFEMPQGDPEIEAAVVRHFLSIQVDGIVLLGSTLKADDPVLREVKARGVGIVAVDPRHPLPVSRITLDRGKAMGMKLRYLYDLGHRRMAILGMGSDDMYRKVRTRGLKEAADTLGLDFGRDLVLLDDSSFSHQDYMFGAGLARQVMTMGPEGPTALVCLNDRLAIGAMRALQEAGKRVPEDFSVIGFDNLPETAWSHPALTTVDQNIRTQMKLAQQALWRSINGNSQSHQIVEPRLVIRGSTSVAPSL